MVRPLLLLMCLATLAVSEAGKKVPGQEDGQGLRKEACKELLPRGVFVPEDE